jgi:hypothetical protein
MKDASEFGSSEDGLLWFGFTVGSAMGVGGRAQRGETDSQCSHRGNTRLGSTSILYKYRPSIISISFRKEAGDISGQWSGRTGS